MKRSVLASLLLFAASATAAVAQTFPTVPSQSVIGRLGTPGTSGPSQAIPFATLLSQIGAVPTGRNINTTAPLGGGGNLSVDRTLSITGSAGGVLAGSGPAFTATPTLGVAGSTVGSIAFANATSGTVTLTPATGALGGTTAVLPIGIYAIVGDALTQTLTNKTINCSNNTCTVPFSSLPTIAADSLLGNPTGSTATMQAVGLVNCSNALTYSTSTHTFGCNVTGGTGTVTSVGSGSGLTGGPITSSGTLSIDPAYGGWKLLNTLTASSSASLSDTTNFTSAYREYEIVFENLLPATNNTDVRLRVQSGGSFQTTSYNTVHVYGNGSAVSSTTATTSVQLTATGSGITNTAGNEFSGQIQIFGDPASTTARKKMVGQFYYNTTATVQVGGMWNNTAAITGIEVTMSSGNITSGTVRIYGRN